MRHRKIAAIEQVVEKERPERVIGPGRSVAVPDPALENGRAAPGSSSHAPGPKASSVTMSSVSHRSVVSSYVR